MTLSQERKVAQNGFTSPYTNCRASDFLLRPATCTMSSPAEKAFPAPVIVMKSTDLADAAFLTARVRSLNMLFERAFNTLGRFKVISAVFSFTLYSTSASLIIVAFTGSDLSPGRLLKVSVCSCLIGNLFEPGTAEFRSRLLSLV